MKKARTLLAIWLALILTLTLFPTALADGLATACFVTAPDELARAFDFECAAVHADRTAIMSRHFPGNFFTV